MLVGTQRNKALYRGTTETQLPGTRPQRQVVTALEWRLVWFREPPFYGRLTLRLTIAM